MVQAFGLIAPALLALVVQADISEPGLKQFCQHMTLDWPGGLSETERQKEENTCQQTYNYEFGSDSEARAFCRYSAPFLMKNYTRDANQITCKWKSVSTCVDSKSVLVKGKCFFLGLPGSYSQANSRCASRNGTLHRITNSEQARWVTILLPISAPVFVANKREDTSYYMMEHMRTWTGGDFRDDKSKGKAWALLARFNDLHAVYAGKIIKTDEKLVLRALCSAPAVSYIGAGNEGLPQFPNVMFNDGVRDLIVPNSVYQPTATSEENIDTSHFHKQCEKICGNCFAALPDMTKELAAAKDVAYVSGRHVGKDVMKNDKCEKYQFSQILRNSFQTISTSATPGAINKSSWTSSYPDNMCADTPRTAVVSQKNGKIKDSPAISRHHIVCVFGDTPETEKFSLCRDHSVPDENGDCKCVTDFRDITNTTLKEAKNFKKGQLCVPENPCKTMEDTMVIDFLVDSSQSLGRAGWDALIQFLLTAGPQLPTKAKIGITQFSGPDRDTDIIHHWWLKDGWTVNDFNKQVLDMEYIEGYTPIYKAVETAHEEFKKVQATKKLAILITDGEATGYDPLDYIKKFRKETGARLVVVPIGPWLQQIYLRTMKTWVADVNEDYIDLTKQGFDVGFYTCNVTCNMQNRSFRKRSLPFKTQVKIHLGSLRRKISSTGCTGAFYM